MKKFSILASLLLGFVTASVQAGEEVYKQVAPPPPPPLYGTGFYGAINMGANVFQDLPDARTFTADFNRFMFDLKYDPKNEVGFFGGIKLGYVFGTGVVRPTLEGDFFYNGFRPGADFTLNGAFDGEPFFSDSASVSSWINSGAFMGNFILRFAFGRFQPYVGAGVGVYYGESTGVDIRGDLNLRIPPDAISTVGNRAAFADLAWQVIAGVDYYWTPKFSTFIEYHFLDYTSDTLIAVRDPENRQFIQDVKKEFDLDLGQHLVGFGVRFHF